MLRLNAPLEYTPPLNSQKFNKRPPRLDAPCPEGRLLEIPVLSAGRCLDQIIRVSCSICVVKIYKSKVLFR